MSAYVCDDLAISQSADFLMYSRQSHGTTFYQSDAETLANDLHAMNRQAVQERYPDSDELPGPIGGGFRYTSSPLAVPMGQSLKTLECLLCQCSQGEVPSCDLYKSLERAIHGLRRRLLEIHCSEYRDAEWGAWEPKPEEARVYSISAMMRQKR